VHLEHNNELAVTGDLVADAMLASMAIELGESLLSTDRDFSRFPRLRLDQPAHLDVSESVPVELEQRDRS
jgi:hypothetical protein